MSLPEIPADVLEAIREGGYIDVSRSDDLETWRQHLSDAWPHLYAAALRHAADVCPYEEDAGFDCLTPDGLRRLADEASPRSQA